MKKQEVIDLASRRGLCVYEQYKGRHMEKIWSVMFHIKKIE